MTGGLPRATIRKWGTLAALSVLGVCLVSVPVLIALVLSGPDAGRTPDAVAGAGDEADSATTARAASRCIATRGHYALTIDDGPFAGTTPSLVAAIAREGATATFFDVGERAAAHGNLVALQRHVGQVANHTYRHLHMTRLSRAHRLRELERTADVLGPHSAFYRDPYGESDPATDADVRAAGLTPVGWTIDAQSGGGPSEAIVARAMRVRAGGILLLRDGDRRAVAAVGRILGRLAARGMCTGRLTLRPASASSGRPTPDRIAVAGR
ncbi:polysaccharide deacetylase family protein [Baekduia soli]|nr:polysaccharide deacetylase family protein [Baekduia soli]